MRQIFSALFTVFFGVFFLVGALQLPIKSAGHIGPAHLPIALGAILIVLALCILLQPDEGDTIAPGWRPTAAITGSIVGFGLMLEVGGLIPAVILSVCVAALADANSRASTTIVLGLGLSLAMWGIFGIGLNLPVPAIKGLG